MKLAMESIIAANAFFSNNGNLIGVGGARVVERNVTEYELVYCKLAGFPWEPAFLLNTQDFSHEYIGLRPFVEN